MCPVINGWADSTAAFVDFLFTPSEQPDPKNFSTSLAVDNSS